MVGDSEWGYNGIIKDKDKVDDGGKNGGWYKVGDEDGGGGDTGYEFNFENKAISWHFPLV